MKNHNQFIRCVENIQDLTAQKHFDYALMLAGGLAYSRKTIKYDPKTRKYNVKNHIDGSKEVLTERALLKSNIGTGICKRCLIAIIN